MAEHHGSWVNTEGAFYCDEMLSRVRKQDEMHWKLETPEKKEDELQPPSPGTGVHSSWRLPSLAVMTTCSSSNEPTQGSSTVSRRCFKQADDWMENA